jgi:hypothetical protein
MDLKFDKRQSKRYKEKQNKEFNGKYCKKHIRIQENNLENHKKNKIIILKIIILINYINNN